MRFTQQDWKNLQEVVTKLDQVDQVEGGDPDDKSKGQEETSSENSDTKEEEEINQVIQDQVWGIGVKNQEKHDIHQAKTEGTEYQAKAKGGVRNEGIGDSQLENKQRGAITERPLRHRVKTKGKEEATRIAKGCKGPVITKKRGKKKKENSGKNSDTEEEEEINQVIQDQVQVQARRRYADLESTSKYLGETDNGAGYQDNKGRGQQVPGRDDWDDMYKAGGAGLDDMS